MAELPKKGNPLPLEVVLGLLEDKQQEKFINQVEYLDIKDIKICFKRLFADNIASAKKNKFTDTIQKFTPQNDQEMKELRLKLQALEDKYNCAVQQYEEVMAELDELKASKKSMTSQLQNKEKEMDRIKDNNKLVYNNHTKTAEANARIDTTCKALELILDEKTEENEQQKLEIQNQDHIYDGSIEQLDKLKLELKELESQNIELHMRNHAMEMENQILGAKIVKIEQSKKSTEDELEILPGSSSYIPTEPFTNDSFVFDETHLKDEAELREQLKAKNMELREIKEELKSKMNVLDGISVAIGVQNQNKEKEISSYKDLLEISEDEKRKAKKMVYSLEYQVVAKDDEITQLRDMVNENQKDLTEEQEVNNMDIVALKNEINDLTARYSFEAQAKDEKIQNFEAKISELLSQNKAKHQKLTENETKYEINLKRFKEMFASQENEQKSLRGKFKSSESEVLKLKEELIKQQEQFDSQKERTKQLMFNSFTNQNDSTFGNIVQTRQPTMSTKDNSRQVLTSTIDLLNKIFMESTCQYITCSNQLYKYLAKISRYHGLDRKVYMKKIFKDFYDQSIDIIKNTDQNYHDYQENCEGDWVKTTEDFLDRQQTIAGYSFENIDKLWRNALSDQISGIPDIYDTPGRRNRPMTTDRILA